MSKFASSGVVVGQTRRDRRAQVLENKSGNSVTMGKSVPRQNEGKVGDITVREITNIGLICYIKTNSGWYDINSFGSSGNLAWKKVAYHATANWTDYDSNNQVKYAKDSNGFVHLRGQAKTASAGDASGNDIIFTLPAGFRPITSFGCVVVTGNLGYQYHSTCRIQTDGNADIISPANTTQASNRVVFDGISFFANTTIVSFGGGTTTGGGSGGGGAHGGGAGGGA